MFCLGAWMVTPRRIRSKAMSAGLLVERSFWGIGRTTHVPPPYRIVAQLNRYRGTRWIQIRVIDRDDRRRNLAKVMVDLYRPTSGRRVVRSIAQLLLADPIVEWRFRSKLLGTQDVLTGEFTLAREKAEIQ
jgi:hypothetical protein